MTRRRITVVFAGIVTVMGSACSARHHRIDAVAKESDIMPAANPVVIEGRVYDVTDVKAGSTGTVFFKLRTPLGETFRLVYPDGARLICKPGTEGGSGVIPGFGDGSNVRVHMKSPADALDRKMIVDSVEVDCRGKG